MSDEEVRSFIESASLPEPPPVAQGSQQDDQADFPFRSDLSQGTVIGSNLVAWAEQTPIDVRRSVSDSMLFAQLYADKQVSDRERVKEWMDSYFYALTNIGWLLAEEAGNETRENASGTEVYEKILALITVALGPVPTALNLVVIALNSLHGMTKDSPWISLFNRKSEQAHAAGLQFAYAAEEGGTATLTVAAFRLEAQQTITQVLFFKFNSANAKVFLRTVSMSIDGVRLTEWAPEIRSRVSQFQRSFIKTLPDSL